MVGPTIRRLRGVLHSADSVRVGGAIFDRLYNELRDAEDDKYPWLRNSDPQVSLPNLMLSGKPVIMDSSLPDEAMTYVSYK